MAKRRPDVVVLGAGVIGLTTGVCLAEQGLRVQMRTHLAPSATTSAVASAMIGPSFAPADDPAGVRERVGIAEFTALAAMRGTGVALRRGRLASRQAGSPLPGLERCAPGELPGGFAAAFWATLPLVDMPVYLDYLVRRLAAAGGQIELAEVASLNELAEHAPLLANCAGLGARELVPDALVRPVRGQHVILDNPGLEDFFIEAPFGPAWTAYWPHAEHVVRHPGGGRRRPGADPRRRGGDPAPLHRGRTAAAAGADPRAPGGFAPRAVECAAGGRTDRRRPVRAQLRARRQRGDAVLGLRTRDSRAAHRSADGMSSGGAVTRGRALVSPEGDVRAWSCRRRPAASRR